MLNKKDIFENMIKQKELKSCFPEYTGGDDGLAATEYIAGQFKARFEKVSPEGKVLTVYIISARVRREIKESFGEIKTKLKHGTWIYVYL